MPIDKIQSSDSASASALAPSMAESSSSSLQALTGPVYQLEPASWRASETIVDLISQIKEHINRSTGWEQLIELNPQLKDPKWFQNTLWPSLKEMVPILKQKQCVYYENHLLERLPTINQDIRLLNIFYKYLLPEGLPQKFKNELLIRIMFEAMSWLRSCYVHLMNPTDTSNIKPSILLRYNQLIHGVLREHQSVYREMIIAKNFKRYYPQNYIHSVDQFMLILTYSERMELKLCSDYFEKGIDDAREIFIKRSQEVISDAQLVRFATTFDCDDRYSSIADLEKKFEADINIELQSIKKEGCLKSLLLDIIAKLQDELICGKDDTDQTEVFKGIKKPYADSLLNAPEFNRMLEKHYQSVISLSQEDKQSERKQFLADIETFQGDDNNLDKISQMKELDSFFRFIMFNGKKAFNLNDAFKLILCLRSFQQDVLSDGKPINHLVIEKIDLYVATLTRACETYQLEFWDKMERTHFNHEPPTGERSKGYVVPNISSYAISYSHQMISRNMLYTIHELETRVIDESLMSNVLLAIIFQPNDFSIKEIEMALNMFARYKKFLADYLVPLERINKKFEFYENSLKRLVVSKKIATEPACANATLFRDGLWKSPNPETSEMLTLTEALINACRYINPDLRKQLSQQFFMQHQDMIQSEDFKSALYEAFNQFSQDICRILDKKEKKGLKALRLYSEYFYVLDKIKFIILYSNSCESSFDILKNASEFLAKASELINIIGDDLPFDLMTEEEDFTSKASDLLQTYNMTFARTLADATPERKVEHILILLNICGSYLHFDAFQANSPADADHYVNRMRHQWLKMSDELLTKIKTGVTLYNIDNAHLKIRIDDYGQLIQKRLDDASDDVMQNESQTESDSELSKMVDQVLENTSILLSDDMNRESLPPTKKSMFSDNNDSDSDLDLLTEDSINSLSTMFMHSLNVSELAFDKSVSSAQNSIKTQVSKHNLDTNPNDTVADQIEEVQDASPQSESDSADSFVPACLASNMQANVLNDVSNEQLIQERLLGLESMLKEKQDYIAYLEKRYVDQNLQAEETVKQLELEKDKMAKKKNTLSNQLDDLQISRGKLSQKVQAQRAEINVLKDKMAKSQKQTAELKQRLMDSEAKLKEALASSKGHQRASTDKASLLKVSEEKCHSLERKIAKLNLVLQKSQKELIDLRAKHEADLESVRREDQSRAQKQIDEMDRQHKIKVDELNAHMAALALDSARLPNIIEQASFAEQRADELNRQLAEKTSELHHLLNSGFEDDSSCDFRNLSQVPKRPMHELIEHLDRQTQRFQSKTVIQVPCADRALVRKIIHLMETLDAPCQDGSPSTKPESQDCGARTFIDGGFPRCLLAGMPFSDIDLITNRSAQYVLERKGQIAGFNFVQNPNIPHLFTDHQLKVDLVCNPNLDLELEAKQRDLTCNALFVYYDRQAMRVLDPLNSGIDDIHTKTLRVIGDIRNRFSDDPSRALRLLRFHLSLDWSLSDLQQSIIKQYALRVTKIPFGVFSKNLRVLMEQPKALHVLCTGGYIDQLFNRFQLSHLQHVSPRKFLFMHDVISTPQKYINSDYRFIHHIALFLCMDYLQQDTFTQIDEYVDAYLITWDDHTWNRHSNEMEIHKFRLCHYMRHYQRCYQLFDADLESAPQRLHTQPEPGRTFIPGFRLGYSASTSESATHHSSHSTLMFSRAPTMP